MAKITEQQMASKFGWHRLGKMDCEVEVKLTDAEKMELGQSQGESICEITRLEEELSGIKKEYKLKIETLRQVIDPAAEMLRTGMKTIIKTLPAFYDPDTRDRKFVDLETGAIEAITPASPSDMQMGIEHAN